MKELSKLMEFRPSIKVLDATLRDGGLVNDFRFTDEFAKAIYQTNINAGVDYMEFGYRADKKMFDATKFGKWKFSSDDDILSIIGNEKSPQLKLAIMADVGRCDYKNDIQDRKNSPVDLIRIATYIQNMPSAIEMIEDAKKKGYEVSCNIMAISNAQESDLGIALEMLGKSPVDCIYIVDSFGSLYPEQIQRLVHFYKNYADRYGKSLGIHAHNNQQLAFANTIESVSDGVDWLDATYGSMGRGAGNCSMELLLGFLKNPKYHIFPVIEFLEKYIAELKKEGTVWGYDWQYIFTGQLNQHPKSAIDFTKEKRTDLAEFYKEISHE